ncbi:MAG: Tetratricopeptide 1 repeat-containing protein [Planctomycetaceae bacterium]|nr:Tetratricopeptide 1 repeat-containing protein [Planctomycetaceae bacterium]
MNVHLMRAGLLMEQSRWQMAEQELRQALMQDGDDSDAHRLLALCLDAQDRYDDAENEARMAIHLAPDDSSAHAALAGVLTSRNRFDAALDAVGEALRLDPYNSRTFGLASFLWFQKKEWQRSLETADKGLEIDSEDRGCLNYRAMALVKLGRQAEAERTLDGVLALDPNDSRSHANQGWTSLERGERDKALVHFREALALDPMNEWARQGMLEALKAKYFLYRILLSYFLFMAKLSTRTQWMIMIGMFVLQNLVADISRRNPAAAPYLKWLLFTYSILVLFTWLGYPLFNLLLFTNRFGRLTLFREQKQGAITVGTLLLCAASSYGLSWYWSDIVLEIGALYVAILAIPASAIFLCPEGRPKWTMLGVTVLLGCVAFSPIVFDLAERLGWQLLNDQGQETLLWSLKNYVWGIIASQFLANYLINQRPER